MRILIVSDAWHPQVNGVVRTLSTVQRELQAMGHVVHVIGPDRFRTVPCPTYPEIRLALLPGRKLASSIDDFAPDAIHIATEGPLGMAARRYCLNAACLSPPPITRAFPNTCAPACCFRWPGPTPSCAASMASRRA